MGNYDEMKLSVEALSGGKNTVLLDDLGLPSIYVVIPKGKISDVLSGGTQTTHPAFIVNSAELDSFYFSKYANVIERDRAYSLPFRDPACYLNFDRAVEVCENKGTGFHLATNAELAYLSLWCKKNGTVPRGNNLYGADYQNPQERGVVSYTYESGGKMYDGRVFTGSGPVTWAHDHTNAGIYGLNGNVWKWTGGMRLMNGEIQIIPYNNAAAHVPQNKESTFWKAILPNGNLVAPGTAGTLKYDSVAAGNSNQTATSLGDMIINTAVEHPQYTGVSTDDYWAYGYMDAFKNLTAKAGVTVPEIMKALCLAPDGGATKNGAFWVRNYGERLPVRCGGWRDAANAGVDALSLFSSRAHSSNSVGLFSAFVNLKSA